MCITYLALGLAPDILGCMTIAFTPEPEVAEPGKALPSRKSRRWRSNQYPSDSPLDQIIEQRDSSLL
jgi:hypothetical protein